MKIKTENNRIGFFDSGVGGLSIWLEFTKILPRENSVYWADSNNCPYGTKSDDEIKSIVKKITQFLINDHHTKMIVVACNTASGVALNYLRENFPNKIFVGIEPAIKLAATQTKNKTIGVLATAGTFRGTLFNQTYEKYCKDKNIKMIIEDAKELATQVENGKINDPETKKYLKKYLDPMIKQNADQIVLGCTHYPFLIDVMKELVPTSTNIINPAPSVAQQIKRLLVENNITNLQPEIESDHKFYVNGNSEVLRNFLEKYYFKKNYIIEEKI